MNEQSESGQLEPEEADSLPDPLRLHELTDREWWIIDAADADRLIDNAP